MQEFLVALNASFTSIIEKGLWKTHWTLALVKGIREPHEVKKKFFWPRRESNPRPPDQTQRHPAAWATSSDRESSEGLSWVSHSTLIITSELILCSTICVHGATRHNIHMYPYFLFAAIRHLNRPRLSLSDLVAQSAGWRVYSLPLPFNFA